MALLVALLLVIQGAFAATYVLEATPSAWQRPAQFVDYTNYVLVVLVFSLFPTGRFVPRWTPWLVAWMAVVQVVDFFPAAPVAWTNAAQLGIIGPLLGLVVAQVIRFRRSSDPVQRQQTKWVFFAVVIVTLLEIVLSLPYLVAPSHTQQGGPYDLFDLTLGFFLPVFIPLSFGIAILRYRLWDIDALINRALVYGTLTAILAGLYLAVVVGAQALVWPLTGRGAPPPGLIVVTTLAGAALFNPLRRRIQAFIDRRFYRRKYDAQRTLAAFGQILRGEVDLDTLRAEVERVVEETMAPTHVFLWLREPVRAEQPETSRADGVT
jgi:hypothetical protein